MKIGGHLNFTESLTGQYLFYIFNVTHILTRISACLENRTALLPPGITPANLAITDEELEERYQLQKRSRICYIYMAPNDEAYWPTIMYLRNHVQPTEDRMARRIMRMNLIRERIAEVRENRNLTPEEVRAILGETIINIITLNIEDYNRKFNHQISVIKTIAGRFMGNYGGEDRLYLLLEPGQNNDDQTPATPRTNRILDSP